MRVGGGWGWGGGGRGGGESNVSNNVLKWNFGVLIARLPLMKQRKIDGMNKQLD